ncbi:hypothetical protein NKR23_g9466 [Pleurostoma richardsiae]|uniref:Glyoxalase-like domain-containing protein n=1 Tax=Pleurostoma richardsiae TaxID=41990 RepID=A0AA38RFG6_9PEZI|nr:hypothetical protein NKR23_g9466 [Pleurostoma richardsiae]
MASEGGKPVLDHIVILLPHPKLLELPSWLTDAFTVLNGGRHADGVTENKLILLEDGVYLELIAFIEGKEKERQTHKWGHRLEGHIIDWAYTLLTPAASDGNTVGSPEDKYRVIQDRIRAAKTGIEYDDPVGGGRITPGGTELRWATASPHVEEKSLGDFLGGEAPFWCLDRTPRPLRVPHHVAENVRHPSGATGIQSVSVFVKDKKVFDALHRTYDALQGTQGTAVSAEASQEAYRYDVGAPEGNTHRPPPSIILAQPTEATGESAAVPDVYVKLAMYSKSGQGKVAGVLAGGWELEIELVAS